MNGVSKRNLSNKSLNTGDSEIIEEEVGLQMLACLKNSIYVFYIITSASLLPPLVISQVARFLHNVSLIKIQRTRGHFLV